MGSFPGGIHPPQHKDASVINPIKQAVAPPIVTIPLVQHVGKPAIPLVRVGDTVKVGTKIGDGDGFISSAIHSSVSGTVRKIDFFPHPVVGKAMAVQIESDGKDERDASIVSRKNPESLSPEEIISIVKEAGIVGLGGAAFPTHVKLSPPSSKKIDTVILNGAECEPYLTCDHMLMLYNTVDVIKGARLVMKALGARQCFIGVEKNKMDALEFLFSKVRGMHITDITPVPLTVKYPQGAEKQLIKTILNREVPSGGLPMDIGVVVQNVGTAIAIYEAAHHNKPLYERLLTVCGMCVKTSQNVRVRIGSSFAHVINEIGGLINTPLKVIMGGPMTGVAQEMLDVPVIKGTSGILTINPGEYRFPRTRPCIRCGRCVSICPVGLMPNVITLAGDAERYIKADKWRVHDCMECGACAYVCPAKRPMVHTIKMIKSELMRREKVSEEVKKNFV